jgi:transposase-like protein
MGRKISQKVKNDVIAAYKKGGFTILDIARKYGVGYESVRRWTGLANIYDKASVYKKKDNVVVSKNNPGERFNSRWTASEDELLREAVTTNMTVKATADLLGRTKPSIYCRKINLIERGIIEDPETRFVIPKGIKRVRGTKVSEPEIEEILQEIQFEVPVVERETPTMSIPELADLARVVKEYGVNVTLSLTSTGMEVKMSN